MVFPIIDTETGELVALVKAKNREEIKERIIVKDSEHISTGFSTGEIQALDSSDFAFISG